MSSLGNGTLVTIGDAILDFLFSAHVDGFLVQLFNNLKGGREKVTNYFLAYFIREISLMG